jgi:uncharacterized protein (DUF1697 family)
LPKYIALLRGVNVAGRRKVPMADLRTLCETIGHTDVRTYIQSGNVVFGARSGPAPKIRSALETAIAGEFSFDVTVLLRTATEMAAVVKRNPYGTDAYVTFLDGAPAKKLVTAIDPDAFTPDEFKMSGHEVFLHCPNGYGNTKINNTFFERKLATEATTRNWNTVTTLLDWARA